MPNIAGAVGLAGGKRSPPQATSAALNNPDISDHMRSVRRGCLWRGRSGSGMTSSTTAACGSVAGWGGPAIPPVVDRPRLRRRCPAAGADRPPRPYPPASPASQPDHPDRPCPQPRSGAAHTGHSSLPSDSRRSTSASSVPTVSMGVSARLVALPAAQPKDDREGPPRPDMLTLSSDLKKGNQFRLPDTTLSPDDA